MKSAAAAVTVSKGIDLDLGCLYELADGRKGVIQALGNAFGRWMRRRGSCWTATTAPAGHRRREHVDQPRASRAGSAGC